MVQLNVVLLFCIVGVAPCTSFQENEKVVDKSFKICSVLGGLDITRLVSSNTRSFFEGAIEDVELIREFVSEAAINGAIRGGMSNLTEMAQTFDWRARGYDEAITTVDAGMGYFDDRVDRRIARYVSLSENTPFVGSKESDMDLINSVSLIFPWIIDRKSNEKNWWTPHQNGRSQGEVKPPLSFESLYTAAWIGTYGEAWAYYPPLRVYGHPFGFGDLLGDAYNSHEEEFVKPNLPENNPERRAFFTAPYPDTAVPGLSLITAMAPVYITGKFRGYSYNDTYLASTGVDIAVSSVSTLLDVLENKLTNGSFGILVDSSFNTIVISQSVVEKVYPPRTGFEESRVTYDFDTGSTILVDRRNQTYLVSDTIQEGLTKLDNADWVGLQEEVNVLNSGERGYTTLDLTLTGQNSTESYYVIYERWEHIADWVLLVFAPTTEVVNAISVGMFNNDIGPDHSFVYMEGTKGGSLDGEVMIVNNGTLDVSIALGRIPDWIHIPSEIEGNTKHTLRAGENLVVPFEVKTNDLDFGTTSASLTYIVQDDSYPDCFHDQEIVLPISVKVTPTDTDINKNYIPTSIRALGMSFGALGMSLAVAFSIWTYLCRKTHVVRASQPVFMQLLCFGCFLFASSVIPLGVDPGIASVRICDIACMTSPWLLSVGNSLMFGALYTKTRRICKVVDAANRLSRVQIKPIDVSVPLFCLLGVNVLILSLWTGIAPMEWQTIVLETDLFGTPTDTRGLCRSSPSEDVQDYWTDFLFLALLSAVNLSAIGLALYSASRAQKISVEFAESKYIFRSLIVMLLAAFIGLPSLLLAGQKNQAAFFYAL